jgi:diguanylate cyclase (GGDEF)-like protein
MILFLRGIKGIKMEQQILLIDDTPQIHSLVTTLLSTEPVKVHSAIDGEYGLTLARSLKPDLILLDIDMPGIDGYEVCRRLKADPEMFNTPVIFLTALSGPEDKVHGLRLGAVDYVSKPFNPAELLGRVRSALRTHRLIRLLEEKAMIDALTGLGNKAMFQERLDAEVAMRIRTQRPLAVVIADVDGFQKTIDACGLPFGDRVLQQIATTISHVCRIEDVSCRLGGDAFAILAPNTDAGQATLLGKRLLIALSKIELEYQGTPVPLKCSVAMAPSMDTYDRLMLQRAQEAMEQARRQGRGGVAMANAESWAAVSAA